MTRLPPPTASELKQLFAEHGVRPSRGRGQNFLVNPHFMELVVQEAALEPRDVVLEPGPGTGGLTGLIAEQAGAVVAVEVDEKLHALAARRLAVLPNVHLVLSDIMGNGDGVAPDVCRMVQSLLMSLPDSRFKIVSNLPYSVSTAFITTLLVSGPVPCDMVVMVQREVAERICAAPGSDDYGYLSVVVQALARTKMLHRVSPGAFWPQPDVDSCILRIRPDEGLRAAAGDVGALRRVAGGLFQFRRKQLIRSLQMAKLTDNREEGQRVLSALGAAESARCETLTVDQFIRLAKLLS